jgi:GT2 family glycosyltransferase
VFRIKKIVISASQTAMKKPLVSIIISNLNGMTLDLLPDCLDSLTNPNYNNWELFVVDNNSSDSSVKYLQKRFKKLDNCHLVQNPINMYSQGLNLGAHHANGIYLAFFNNDVALHKGYFQELISQLEKDSKLAIAQGKLLNYYDRKKIDSAGETMDIYGNPITIGAGELDKGQFDKIEPILSASGSACIIKKTLFDKIGGYDPDYGIGYEDMDLALRARRLGYKVRRFPKAIVYHKRASTDLAPFIRIQVKWHFNKNRLATMLKNYPLLLLLKSLPVTIILYLGITCYEWFIRRNWPIGLMRITSIWYVTTHLLHILSKRAAIDKLGAKSISTNDLRLFSPKPLIDLFKDFAAHK